MKKISTVQVFGNEILKKQKLTIGVDLGDRWSFYCVLEEAGKIILEQKVPTTPEAMKQTFLRIPQSRIAMETGTHSPWVSRLLTELGHEVIVAREHSSGASCKRGGITKTGNVHLRRIVVEAASAYRHAPAVTACLRKRQERVSEEVKEIAWKAQHRLHGRYRRLTARGKNTGKVITAVGRELLGFIWAIAVKVEAEQRKALGQAA